MLSNSRESACFNAELEVASAGRGLRLSPPPAKRLLHAAVNVATPASHSFASLKHVDLSVATPISWIRASR
jgi:hypothetical protein